MMRRFLTNSMLVCGSVCATLVGIELVLRVVGLSFPVFIRSDDVLGWSFFPKVEGYSVHEARAWVRINEAGFRDIEHQIVKPAGTFRIAVLGDSFTEGSNVAEAETFPSVMATALSSCAASKQAYEVLNFGVSGYGTAQSYLLLDRSVLQYQPDLVILAFYNGNDVADNSRPLSVESQKFRPYYISQNETFSIDNSFRLEAPYRHARQRSVVAHLLVNRSYLLQLGKQLFMMKSVWSGQQESQPRRFDAARDGAILVKPQFPEMFSPPVDKTWIDAWSVTEWLILAMRDATLARDMRFLMVLIPDPIQVFPDEAIRRKIKEEYGLADLAYPENRIARLAEKEGIDLLKLREPFLQIATDDPLFLYGFPPNYGDGHWNETGNLLGGRLIGKHVCEKYATHDSQ
ncbi:MAG TPA: GDSL-type esterase/lipase family protein [Nitrospira sp.]|nr:GDSL-type esterase/lipase family protein [Nitrospira sp.]